MTVAMVSADASYRIVTHGPHQRPRSLPGSWQATPLAPPDASRHTIWLIYNPAKHNVATIHTPRPTALRRLLIAAGAQPIAASARSVTYLMPRRPAKPSDDKTDMIPTLNEP